MAAAQIYVPGAMPTFSRDYDACVGRLYFYTNDGTYTPKAVYTSSALTTPHPFPVVSDGSGQFPEIWADSAQIFTVTHATIEADPKSETYTDIAPSAAVINNSPTLAIGSVAQGASAAASITGLSPNFNLNLTLPAGAAASIAVDPNTVTLPPGSAATVVNIGTPTNAVFQFSLPRGSAGAGNMSSTGTIATNDIAVFSDANTVKAGTPATMRTTLGLGSLATMNTANLASAVTGTLAVANGGTGATTLASKSVLVGNGASAVSGVAPGSSGNVLTSNGTDWVSGAPSTNGQVVWVKQEQTSGVAPTEGTLTSGSWTKRVLNATPINQAGAIIASSVITLLAGTYEVNAFASISNAGDNNIRTLLRLRNTTDNVTTLVGPFSLIGPSSVSGTTIYQVDIVQFSGSFTIAGTKNFEIQHYASGALAAAGVAAAVGETELYVHAFFKKVG